MYDYSAFPDDELSLGYSVSVFQESIGQHIVEYLVNFDFFRRVMENYGFTLMNREEATQFGFPNGGTGMFEGLYYDMMAEMSRESTNRYGTASLMTEDEKFISFLNRYFIFRKVRNVAAEKITKLIEDKMPSVEASKCANAAALVAPVMYGSPTEDDQELEGIANIAKTFDKREQIATKERGKESASVVDTKPTHFIRPIADTKMTIRAYEPVEEEGIRPTSPVTVPVEEVRNIPLEDGPAIKLVPKTVRIGNTVRIKRPKVNPK
jgi:hypothetical protein